MSKVKELQQQLKVEKSKEKLAKEEAALKKLNESKLTSGSNKATKTKVKTEPLKEYDSGWINAFQDFIDMLKNNVEGIITVIVVLYIAYILFTF